MVEWRGVTQPNSVSLVDVLDKVLDKGLVVVGDIRVSLASVELLTIKVRLMLCSIDKASEVGLDWWKQDPFFSSSSNAQLQQRIEALERQLQAQSVPGEAIPPAAENASRRPGRRRQQDQTPDKS